MMNKRDGKYRLNKAQGNQLIKAIKHNYKLTHKETEVSYKETMEAKKNAQLLVPNKRYM